MSESEYTQSILILMKSKNEYTNSIPILTKISLVSNSAQETTEKCDKIRVLELFNYKNNMHAGIGNVSPVFANAGTHILARESLGICNLKSGAVTKI